MGNDETKRSQRSVVQTVDAPETPVPPSSTPPSREGESAGFMRRGTARIAGWFDPGQQKSSISALDGVRALACLMVVEYHISIVMRGAHLWLPSDHPLLAALAFAGVAGVTLFFVLSGFLLFLPYARALLQKSSWPSARRFYLRRALRIIPGYYICLFSLIILQNREYLQPDHWKQLALFLLFFMDSSRLTNQAINGPFWTLAVEWQFYLWLPLLALGMRTLIWRLAPTKRLRATILCLCGIVVWGMLSQHWSDLLPQHPLPNTPGWGIFSALFLGQAGKYLQDFAIGMLVSLLYISMRYTDASEKIKKALQRFNPWFWVAGIVLFLGIAIWRENAFHGNGAYWLDPVRGYYDIFGEAVFSVSFGLCILALLFGSLKVQKLFSWGPLRWVGHISYSAYMWHLQILLIFLGYVETHMAGWHPLLIFAGFCFWVLLVVLPLSAISFLLTERPGMLFSNWLWREKRKSVQT